MADRPRAPPASISTATHFSTQRLRDSVRRNTRHGPLTGMTALPYTVRLLRAYISEYFFTLVQGQTPVTPPTLANTKENWMEEGPDHVICMDKCRLLIRLTWRRLVIDTLEANMLSFPRFFERSVLYYANLTITAAV